MHIKNCLLFCLISCLHAVSLPYDSRSSLVNQQNLELFSGLPEHFFKTYLKRAKYTRTLPRLPPLHVPHDDEMFEFTQNLKSNTGDMPVLSPGKFGSNAFKKRSFGLLDSWCKDMDLLDKYCL